MSQTNQTDDVAARGRELRENGMEWQAARQQFLATGNAAALQAFLTREADAAVVAAWEKALAPVLSKAVLLAGGGYGRGEMYPYSDAEIIVVREDPAPAALNDAMGEFVRLLWEKGIALSPRVCTLADCLSEREQNFDLHIKLMDRRRLAGDEGLAALAEERLQKLYASHGRELAVQLAALTRARHAKYNHTPSFKEPDVKETPGGLRDLRLVGRLGRLVQGQSDDPSSLAAAAAFLASARAFLHYRAKEDANVLHIAAQDEMAARFLPVPSSEVWMRRYFEHARVVANQARRALDALEAGGGSLIGTFRQWQSRLSNAEFTVLHERVFARKPAEFASDPMTVFPLLEFIAQHGIPAAPETERRLEDLRPVFAEFRKQPRPMWAALKSLFSLPKADLAIRTLYHAGLLGVMFPEWKRIEGAAGNRTDYPCTLDEHTLAAVESVCRLRENADAARQGFAEVLSEVEDPSLLLFALLFHHAGESAEDPDGSRLAPELGGKAAASIEMAPDDREMVVFLVAQHGLLSDAAGGRDMDDPATVRTLAAQIGTVERLRLLTVLTFADVAATAAESMVPWRLDQLWRTYQATYRELTRELETERIDQLPEDFSGDAEFIRGLPVRYLRARSVAEVEAHAQLYERSKPTGVAVELEPSGGVYKLSIVARDLPGLFASFAGALSSFGLDILKAEAFSNAKHVILDTFIFADPKRTLELNPPEAERLQDLIRRVALGKTDAARLLRNRPRKDRTKRSVESRVEFDSEACETATLVEIITEDRPGLLYSLATVFAASACNIDIVLIDTKGNRAIDVFYVAQDGKKLAPDAQARLRERLLAACVGD